jgi:Protein of unknown function (DUF2849)
MSTVISANRLDDGTVTYLDTAGNWVGELAGARVFTAKAEEEAGLEQAQRAVSANFILDPLVVAIEETADGRRAISLRNAIRAEGPTIDYVTSTEGARS